MKHKLSEYCVKRISSINLLIQLTPRNVKFVHFYSIIIIAICGYFLYQLFQQFE